MSHILDSGVVAVIRAPDIDQGYQLAEAANRGGITAIEIAMTVPGALQVVHELAYKYPGGEVLLGAGTVLDPRTARLAILAGAEYIVSPSFNTETVRMCHRYRKVAIPGAISVTEVIQALEIGADAIKIFPASLFGGPEIIKAIKGSLPQAVMIPSGEVTLDNVKEWFKAGADAVAIGTELIQEGLAKRNWDLVEQKAREFVNRIKRVREELNGGK